MQLNAKPSKSGFTLIELVVVIAILGILAAILIPLISNFIEKTNQSVDFANARTLYSATFIWYAFQDNPSDSVNPDLSIYTGQTEYPSIRSSLYSGDFVVTITEDGSVTVDSTSGKRFFP